MTKLIAHGFNRNKLLSFIFEAFDTSNIRWPWNRFQLTKSQLLIASLTFPHAPPPYTSKYQNLSTAYLFSLLLSFVREDAP